MRSFLGVPVLAGREPYGNLYLTEKHGPQSSRPRRRRRRRRRRSSAEAGIRVLAERFEAKGLAVDVSVDRADERCGAVARHPPDLWTAIYRIVQEALTNATKHGLAHRAVVEVIKRDEAVHVAVRDDRHGFDPAVKTSGFGLLGMRERAELLGGTIAVQSAPGRGATIEVTLPVPRRKGEPVRARPGEFARTGS